MLTGFHVTYDIISEESAMEGESQENGFLGATVLAGMANRFPIEEFMKLPDGEREKEICLTLRDALELFREPGGTIEANCSSLEYVAWLTCYSSEMDYETGNTENRSLHFPDGLSQKNVGRICKLLGVKFR